MRVRAADNFNHITVLNRGAQRHHAPVEARAGARVADFRVNHVCKIDGSRAARQLNDFPHRRERVNILGIKIELQRVDEFARVFHFLRPFDQRPQNLQCLIVIAWPALSLLVFPVRGDAFFGDHVHLFGSNLDLEGLALWADDRRVQGLIEIVSGRRDPILEPTWYGLPTCVNYAQCAITVTDFVRSDHPRGH